MGPELSSLSEAGKTVALWVGGRLVNLTMAALFRYFGRSMGVLVLATLLFAAKLTSWQVGEPRWWIVLSLAALVPFGLGLVARRLARGGPPSAEEFVRLHEAEAHAIANGMHREPGFMTRTVLQPRIDLLRRNLVRTGAHQLHVAGAIVRLDQPSHTLQVIHGVGEYVGALEGQSCVFGKETVEGVIARTAEAHFVPGGYAVAECDLVPGEPHYLVVFTNARFPARKRSLVELVAADIEATWVTVAGLRHHAA